MKELRDKVAGLDVHRDTVVACCRIRQSGRSVAITKGSFAATAGGLAELATWLAQSGVTTVAMEATGVYWKPVYYALEGLFEELWLSNAHHVQNVPGRKTDLSDAEWLAAVAAHGMVRPSLVQPPEIRELRELTRYRKTQVDMRTQQIQRLEKGRPWVPVCVPQGSRAPSRTPNRLTAQLMQPRGPGLTSASRICGRPLLGAGQRSVHLAPPGVLGR